ncbi:MAG: nitroreductase family protein [Alphaproteobacteria bacterium]|nr:nitroreductase family protein [Alphaproteobacteria bacterium]
MAPPADPKALQRRFGTDDANLEVRPDAPALHQQLATRGVVRAFTAEPVPYALLERLCALALCAPTKSDLQQRDIVIVDDARLRQDIVAPLAEGPQGQAWLRDAPALLIFCGNNRRQRLWHGWHDIPFANDHLDAFFNASVDAGIALSAFVIAAEAQGLGACPISVIRNDAARISALLKLPPHVFPVAGLGVGWPARAARQSFRLPLAVTVHRDTYNEGGLRDAVESYDRRREAAQPYGQQRYVERFGRAAHYGWSQDKARQYAVPERADFGAYVRERGFRLD